MVLNDSDIIAQVGQGIVPSGLQQPANWYAKDSPVQPASLDLTVGGIFLPCNEDQNTAAPPLGRTQFVLKPGRTAIVLTQEEVKMPPDLVALGFPPSRVSVQGILMTNPGQIDPGYQGPLRFTVINMGSKEYVLRKGDAIVSLVILRLTNPSSKDWLVRNSGKKGGPINWENLKHVSSDFVNVESRAQEIANKAVRDADIKIKRAGIIMTVLAVLIPLVINGLFSYWGPAWKDPLQKVQQDVAVLQSEKNVDRLDNQIKDLQNEVKTLKKQLADNQRPSKP